MAGGKTIGFLTTIEKLLVLPGDTYHRYPLYGSPRSLQKSRIAILVTSASSHGYPP